MITYEDLTDVIQADNEVGAHPLDSMPEFGVEVETAQQWCAEAVDNARMLVRMFEWTGFDEVIQSVALASFRAGLLAAREVQSRENTLG